MSPGGSASAWPSPRPWGRPAALGPATEGVTKVVVAQRVSTITQADQILVLDSGRLVGRGTHSELLDTSPVYREIVTSQLGAEAAA